LAAFDRGAVPGHYIFMKVRKLDAGLASILTRTPEHAGKLEVFVHTIEPPTAEQAQVLAAVGVQNVLPDKRLFTAVLSLEAVQYLCQQPWVRAVSSAKRLVSLIQPGSSA
jgi:hypothetical protein